MVSWLFLLTVDLYKQADPYLRIFGIYLLISTFVSVLFEV